jgi:hypothetical protein
LAAVAVRARPIVSRTLEPKEYSDAPMEGWKERGAEEPAAYALEAARLGRERLAAREAQRGSTAQCCHGVDEQSADATGPS